ncbi:MAG: D-alanyl-D-alanine carboxypeptidase/D-alanyl-D-alanine-endopeptidase [Planctomycetota bacterium]|nr:D-alanyl-D-alanine carboxypeptidase/D-alanyl-D-alanine-endopeptidase [Planctomycetota bacterium]
MARDVLLEAAGAALLVLGLSALGACGGEVEASDPGSTDGSDPTVALEFPPLGRPGHASGHATRPDPAMETPPRPGGRSGEGDEAPRAEAPLEGALDRPVARILAEARQRAFEASKGRCKPGLTTVAIECVDLATGLRLVSHGAGQPMIPASNLKVVTAGAALLGLGADAEFETVFEAVGPIEGGRLEGDLVVRAGADPMHRREGDGSLAPWFDALVSDLRRAGIESISGDVVLDHGPFVPLGTGPEWPDRRQHWQQYCGLASGFSANGGAYRVTVSSRAKSATVVLRPRNHGLSRRGSVDVGGQRNDLRVGANQAGVTVGGQVPPNFGPFVKEFRHPDPDRLFASALRGALADRGVRFGRVLLPGELSPSRASRGEAVHVMRSPVGSILEAVLGDSNNPVSDQLFALIGGRLAGDGSREGSASAIRRVLVERGVDVDGLVQVEGSGLSRANRLTARTLCDVHAVVASDPDLAPAYVDALLLSGVDEKLGDRMVGTAAEGRVAAKTGWISGASSFSGLVLDDDGAPRLAFAILVSYPRLPGLNSKAWKPMQDQLCTLFASGLRLLSPR